MTLETNYNTAQARLREVGNSKLLLLSLGRDIIAGSMERSPSW